MIIMSNSKILFSIERESNLSHLPLQDFNCIYLKAMVLTNFKQTLGDLSCVLKLWIPPASCWIARDFSALEQDWEWCSWYHHYIQPKGSHNAQLMQPVPNMECAAIGMCRMKNYIHSGWWGSNWAGTSPWCTENSWGDTFICAGREKKGLLIAQISVS